MACDYRIFKYPLEIVRYQKITTFECAKVVHVAKQRNVLCLWCFVDTISLPCVAGIYVVGTGHPCNEAASRTFYGTVFDDGFVWHIFGDLSRKE